MVLKVEHEGQMLVYGMQDDGAGYRRFVEDPDFLPYEVVEEAGFMGMDMSDPIQRSYIRGMVISDPDMCGDWIRSQ